MKLTVPSLLLMAAIAALSARATSERGEARSVVMSRDGIVAAESPLAAQAGVRILEKGGNAVDAAIATNAVMGVVAPMMNGMGGDLFAIVYDAKTGRLSGLNASGWSPRRLDAAYLRGRGIKQMPTLGIHSVTVPGAVEGWSEMAARFGRKRLSDDLAAAIAIARSGYPVTEWTSLAWIGVESVLKADPGAAGTFLIEGKAPTAGQLFRNPDLAASLEAVAKDGREGFYRGKPAEQIVAFMKAKGGTMDAADLADYRAEWVKPISTTYRDWTVYELPPNGQGIAALLMLNIMERFPIAEMGFGSAKALHVEIEAKKLAYADLIRYIGDPRFGKLPVETLLDKTYAAGRAGLIDLAHAHPSVPPGRIPRGADTTYLCVVDREGNMVSLIQSNLLAGGSGLVAPGTGFILQNRGSLFNLEAGSPDVLEGRKRPLHTIIPGFAEHGSVRVAFGIMGGWNQAQAHAQFVSDLADFHFNIQEALEAPRFTKLTFAGNDVTLESRFPEKTIAELKELGHVVEVHGPYSDVVGGGQAVMRDLASGINFGASDPRKDGEAIPELPEK